VVPGIIANATTTRTLSQTQAPTHKIVRAVKRRACELTVNGSFHIIPRRAKSPSEDAQKLDKADQEHIALLLKIVSKAAEQVNVSDHFGAFAR